MTGRPGGIPLADDVAKRLAAAGLPVQTPGRGENLKAGNSTTPGTTVANLPQQAYLADVATKVVLPLFKERNKPFLMVFWSRDPDGTQHNQGDSLGRLVPGINGPTSLAAIKNADDNLGRLLAALKEQGLDGATDVILTSDHGFSTISKESATSWAAQQSYKDVPAGQLPSGFLAIDIAHGLGLPLNDPDSKNAEVPTGVVPARGNGLIGSDPAHPDVVVAANGGSDLVYLPKADKALAAKIVALLSEQDYTSGLFVDEALGAIPGTLPLSAIALKGAAATPTPVHRRQFPLLLDRLRRSDDLRRRSGRHQPAARPGHARQLLARRHAQHHGRHAGQASVGISRTRRRPAMPISARRSRGCSISRSPIEGHLTGRVLERGDAQWRDAGRAGEHGPLQARSRRTRHRADDADAWACRSVDALVFWLAASRLFWLGALPHRGSRPAAYLVSNHWSIPPSLGLGFSVRADLRDVPRSLDQGALLGCHPCEEAERCAARQSPRASSSLPPRSA